MTWTVDSFPPRSVTAPPGKLGFTLREYCNEFIVTDVTQDCSVRGVRAGLSIVSVDGQRLRSLDELPEHSNTSREIVIGEEIMSTDASAHSKGSLMYCKEIGGSLFDMMDFSGVEAKYGKEFHEELAPPHRKTGNQILGDAMNFFSNYDSMDDDDEVKEARGDDVCANCGRKADATTKLKNCTGCHSVKYCGVNCQKKAWRSHKKECKKSVRS